ncbi:hypothetical protein NE865_05227 [Phthorimaea operculella]|nr:hypothetical protein NE865_05227 [Phthorimaea operculella]
MQLSTSRILTVLLGYLAAQTKAYPMQGWPVYPQAPREYQDDDYYYAPKVQYYYDAPAIPANVPDAYGQVPAYPYYYDPYGHYANDVPKTQEERFSALPIGQETWFESESTPRWKSNDVDDVSATFLDNLILTQMAQDAQRRRENARAAFPPVDYEERDVEDEDVRELKALAGKPLYHVPKTVPRIEDDDDYPADDSFINWNGNKRSVTTAAPVTSTFKPKGQREVAIAPSQAAPHNHQDHHNKRSSTFYETVAQLLANKSKAALAQEATKARRIDKRFVAGDSDLVMELRGLKHRIPT